MESGLFLAAFASLRNAAVICLARRRCNVILAMRSAPTSPTSRAVDHRLRCLMRPNPEMEQPDTIEVRPAQPEDAQGLLALWAALADAGQQVDPRYQLRDDAFELARQLIHDEWVHHSGPLPGALAAVADNTVIGFLSLKLSPGHPLLLTSPTVVFGDLYVVDHHRQRGVATNLVKRALRLAEEAGIDHFEVGTLSRDDRAVAFWKATGFQAYRVTLRIP